MYLYSKKAVGRIKHYMPGARMIAVQRNPTERAYSSFLHVVLNGREPLSDFVQGLQAEEERIRNHWEWAWHYRSLGFYHEQLSRCYETFGRDQIKVYLYEDLKDDPTGMLRDIFGFLGVDASFVPKVPARYSATGVPRSSLLNDILQKQNPLKSAVRTFLPKKFRRRLFMNLILVKPPFPEEARRQLVAAYKGDILRLQDLIGRDLSDWLK